MCNEWILILARQPKYGCAGSCSFSREGKPASLPKYKVQTYVIFACELRHWKSQHFWLQHKNWKAFEEDFILLRHSFKLQLKPSITPCTKILAWPRRKKDTLLGIQRSTFCKNPPTWRMLTKIHPLSRPSIWVMGFDCHDLGLKLRL